MRVQWTREDDVRHDFLHTVSAERIEAGLDKSGKVVAWRHRSVAPTILSTFMPGAVHEAPFELGMGFVDMPFDIPNIRCENPEAAAHTRIGWFRSVSNIPHAFAVQSMVAELAHATGRDPKDMLLELIGPPRIVKLNSVPDTNGFGSCMPATTFATPAAISASAQGGVRPWCAQGSRLIYSVAPCARGPASSSARISACFTPG